MESLETPESLESLESPESLESLESHESLESLESHESLESLESMGRQQGAAGKAKPWVLGFGDAATASRRVLHAP